MATLWIEEKDKAVWHRATVRLGHLSYRAACDWELEARHTRVWPQKPAEPGPPDQDRCHACVGRD